MWRGGEGGRCFFAISFEDTEKAMKTKAFISHVSVMSAWCMLGGGGLEGRRREVKVDSTQGTGGQTSAGGSFQTSGQVPLLPSFSVLEGPWDQFSSLQCHGSTTDLHPLSKTLRARFV